MSVRWIAGVLGLAAGCAGGPEPLEPGTLLFFVGTECPVSNFYAPEIRRIGDAWSARGVKVRIVYPEPGLRSEDARRHADRYGWTAPILLGRPLADAHGVVRIPTAVVVGSYRGRIDDRYSPDGKRRDEPRTRDLEAALTALAEGRAPSFRETPVFGCPLP